MMIGRSLLPQTLEEIAADLSTASRGKMLAVLAQRSPEDQEALWALLSPEAQARLDRPFTKGQP